MLHKIKEFVHKWRYPVSSPEEVGKALGLKTTNRLTFDQFVSTLTDPTYCPTNLKKYMPREEAELAFNNAVKKEQYNQETLFYYYFNEGWMEFDLHFDQTARLRRIYLRHKHIDYDMGIEMQLTKLQ